MKSFPFAPLFRHAAVALGMLGAIGACTSDEILGYQPDSGTPPEDASVPRADAAADSGRPDAGPGARCGDGAVDPGEECDDGNAVSGDGCSITCKTEEAPSVPEDSCPGVLLPLTVNGGTRTGSVSGNNSNLLPNFETTCGGGAGRDALYRIESDRQGRATARLTADFAGLLSQRSSCDPADVAATCVNATAEGETIEMVFPLAEGETTFLVVDALASGTGNYTLEVTVEDSSCGDGLAQLPEQCDDGNTANGDGCNSACQLEVPSTTACPGNSFVLTTPGQTVSFAGDTSLASGSTGSSSLCGSVAGGYDIPYAITTTVPGALRAVVHSSYGKPALVVRGECATSNTELACTNSTTVGPISLDIPVEANRTYFFFVDGPTSGATPLRGPFTFDVTLVPATCGDGTVALPEQCDDGNQTDGDGCSSTCQFEAAPIGIESCPGHPISFTVQDDGSSTFVTHDDTSRYPASVWVSCTQFLSAADRVRQNEMRNAVYRFTVPYDGLLEATLDADFYATLDLRRSCVPLTDADPGSSSSLVCTYNERVDRISRLVTAGEEMVLVVKGASLLTITHGNFDLSVQIHPAVCGNGIIEGTEACDDGPWPAGYNHESGCTSTCTIAAAPAQGLTCANAEPLTLTQESNVRYSLSLNGGNWNRTHTSAPFPSPCGATGGREHYYRVTPPIDGMLIARTTDGTYPITLGARASCTPLNATNSLASSCLGTIPQQRIALPVQANVPVIIQVDGRAANNRGRYTLEVEVVAPSCGDGRVAGDEQCDDGNNDDGDGCSATCQLEPSNDSNTCPGRELALTQIDSGAYVATYTLSTADATALTSGSCGGAGRDRVLRIVPAITGTLLVTGTTDRWQSSFYARETCSVAASELACVAADPARPNEITRSLSIPTVAGQPLYLFADGAAGAAGPATFDLVLTP